MGGGPFIVDLSASPDEDDDDDLVCLTEFPAHLAHRTSKKTRMGTMAVLDSDLVILEDVDQTFELLFGAGEENVSQKSSQNSCVSDDDCCILDEDPSKVDVIETSGDNDSEDLVMTGEIGHVACRDYPHARHLCVQFPFMTSLHKAFCAQCHCYVCDTLAPCSHWGDGTRGGDHCHASDKTGERWKALRQSNKAHPPPRPDLSTQQQIPLFGMPPAVTQSSSHPPGYDNLLAPKKTFAQVLSDLSNAERGRRVSNLSGASVSTNNSRGFSPSQPVSTRHIESPSFRDLLGCHNDDSARTQYPLQITLNRHNQYPSSHSRRDHSQYLGVSTRLPKYVRRKEPHLSRTYQQFQQEGGAGCLLRRSTFKNASLPIHLPLSSSSPSSTQSSHEGLSAILPRRPCATAATGEQESRQNVVHDLNATFDYPSLDFESAIPQLQDDIIAHGTQGDGTGGSCNSVDDIGTLFNGEAVSEGKVDGDMESFLASPPPPRLVDYFHNTDVWSDFLYSVEI